MVTKLLNNDICSHGSIWMKEKPLPLFSPETLTNVTDEKVLSEQVKTVVSSMFQNSSKFEFVFKFSS